MHTCKKNINSIIFFASKTMMIGWQILMNCWWITPDKGIKQRVMKLSLALYKIEAAYRRCALKLPSHSCSVGELFISCSIPGRILLTASHLTVWVPPASIKAGIAMWCLCAVFTSRAKFKRLGKAHVTLRQRKKTFIVYECGVTQVLSRKRTGRWGLGLRSLK